MQEDRTESVTSLLFFHVFPITTPLTQETRPRWWVKRKIRAASEGRPVRDGGPCWSLWGGSPSPPVRWGPAGRGPRRARLPRKARTLTFPPRPCGGDNPGQLPRSEGPPQRTRLAPGGSGAAGPAPTRGKVLPWDSRAREGWGRTSRLALGGPPVSQPPPQAPRRSRECKPKRPRVAP